MADRKISDLTALTTPASGDVLPIVDISEAAAASKNKRITIEELMRGVPDGTAAAPGIAFETDPNTGIYSPGADQLAVATNGAQKLLIDSSGNIAVIGGSITNNTAAGVSGNLTFNQSGIGLARVGMPASVNALVFDTWTGAALAERMRITSAGLVGIGTSSPTTTLHVDGTATVDRIINATTGSDPWLKGVNGSGTETSFIKLDGQGYLTKLGIGTSSPAELLDVSGAIKHGNVGYIANGDLGFIYTGTNNSTFGTVIGTKPGTTYGTSRNFTVSLNPASGPGREVFRIVGQSGRVGIGTTSPGSLLHLAATGTSTNAEIIIAGTNTNGDASCQARIGATQDGALTSAALTFSTRLSGTTNERARIDSSGRLGIGTSAPGSRLTVNRVNSADASATGATTLSNAGITVEASTDTNNRLMFGIGSTGSVPWIQAQNTSSNATQSLILNPVGGRVGIGTTSPQDTFHLKTTSGSTTARISSSTNTSGLQITARGDGTGTQIAAFGTSSDLRFFTTTSGGATNEALRVDSNRRLLIGTSTSVAAGSTTPSTLQVSNASGVGATLYSVANANGPGGVLVLGHGRTTSAGLLSSGDVVGQVRFAGGDGGDLVTLAAQISVEVDGTPGANDMPGRLVFSTTADGAASPTERMRITSSGSVQSTNWTFSPSAINSRAVYFATDPGWGGAGAGGLVASNTSNGVVLGVSATSWASYSDIRMKTDLVPIENGLTKVSTLRAVTGRYNTDDANTSRSFLIAQDVEKVLPEAVESGNPDALGLRYTEIIPLLVAALKESKERIEQLETEMAAVKAQLS